MAIHLSRAGTHLLPSYASWYSREPLHSCGSTRIVSSSSSPSPFLSKLLSKLQFMLTLSHFGVYSVGFGAVLAIIIRIRKRIFWLWRVDAGLVRPHATIPWTLLSIFTTACESSSCDRGVSFADERFGAVLELMISRRLLLMEQRPTYNTGYIILLAWVRSFPFTRSIDLS